MTTNTTFFGFALADSMFASDCTIRRQAMTLDEVQAQIADCVPCLNPSHTATINAMNVRFGLKVAIPEIAPKVVLNVGDSLVVMGVRGLPRLDGSRHEYTDEEITKSSFVFTKYTVLE